MTIDIEKIMLSMHDEKQAVNLSRFFKTGKGQYGEGDRFLGIKVPQTRTLVKEYWKLCSLDDIGRLIASPWHEIRLFALLALVQMFKHSKRDVTFQQQCVDFYLSHTQYINNWDLVDLSCYELLGTWLLDKDRSVLYDLASNGKTIWEQRIGMVSCMQFLRNGQCDDALAISRILLSHPHDLIHKAVGWLLREVGKHDARLLEDFLRQHIHEMSRTTLRYAIEKMPEHDRVYWMNFPKRV